MLVCGTHAHGSWQLLLPGDTCKLVVGSYGTWLYWLYVLTGSWHSDGNVTWLPGYLVIRAFW